MARKPKAAAKPPKAKPENKPRKTPKTRADAPGAAGGADLVGHNSKPKLNADEMRELFLRHRESWNAVQAKLKAVKKLETDVKAALKHDGFKVIQMQIADDLATVKGEAKVTAAVENRLQVAKWTGHPMGAQLDMFNQPDRTPAVDTAYDRGKMDSMGNKPRKCSYASETEQYRAYMSGYNDHQRELAGGFKAPKGGAQAKDFSEPSSIEDSPGSDDNDAEEAGAPDDNDPGAGAAFDSALH